MTEIRRVLIANRGEIAVRILRTCRELGIETVGVFSEADREALHSRLADRAVCIGAAPPSESYLDLGAVLAAAVGTQVDAIHPGYGFLAESPELAEACLENDLVFVGPPAEVLRRAGNKLEALRLAAEAGVPTLSGSLLAPLESQDEARATAGDLGYPVLLKASAGGGGRGMRLVRNDAGMPEAFQEAQAESQSSFGDGTLYLERFLPRARHVEVQILADRCGTVVHLGERDCTVQRRYQKLLEEAPSPAITPDLRQALSESAVTLARHIGLQGAGTVEFLVDMDGEDYYFIEVNPRIQVEHPVTEMLTGIDIVSQQIQIAAGSPIPFSQEALRFHGHAIECRINAEDPDDFRPSPGKIIRWEPPLGPGVRVDTHSYLGYTMSPFYDSLLAKVIAWGEDRAHALARMRRALEEFRVEGVSTTIPFHLRLLDEPAFVAGEVHTQWVEERGRGEKAK